MRTFKIPKIPSATSKSIRMSNNLIERIEKEIAGKETTFTAFVRAACEFSLDSMDKTPY